jgi:Protein of unknown function (DUF3108)
MNLDLAKYLLVLLAATLLFFPVSLDAQVKSDMTVPFKAGETVTYEAKFSRPLVPPLTVGDLSFTVLQAPSNSSGTFLIKGEAQSRGIVKMFGNKVSIKIESTIEAEKFRVLNTVKHDDQGERVRDGEATFDYRSRKVTYIETDPNDPARRPYQLAGSIVDVTHDVISGLYSLRLMPLTVGRSFELTVSDSGLVYKIPVSVTAREQQKSLDKKVWTYRVEPEIFGDKRPFAGKGKLVIWITEDASRLPVRALINMKLGKIDVRLKKISTTPN